MRTFGQFLRQVLPTNREEANDPLGPADPRVWKDLDALIHEETAALPGLGSLGLLREAGGRLSLILPALRAYNRVT